MVTHTAAVLDCRLGHSLAIDQAGKGHVVVCECDADSSQPITGGFTGYGKHVFHVEKSAMLRRKVLLRRSGLCVIKYLYVLTDTTCILSVGLSLRVIVSLCVCV